MSDKAVDALLHVFDASTGVIYHVARTCIYAPSVVLGSQ